MQTKILCYLRQDVLQHYAILMVVDGLGEILLEEDKEALGTAGGLVSGGGAGLCSGGSVCDGWLCGVVCSELSGKVGREIGNGRARGKRELLHDTDMGIFSLNTESVRRAKSDARLACAAGLYALISRR